MKIIGITGGIGSGKTAVANIIEKHGFSVYYSDIRAKEILNLNQEVKDKIICLLGENAYDENGKYHREWVANQVFNDNEKLTKLNQLIHPLVKQDFQQWLSLQKGTYAFKETALFFELDMDKSGILSLLVTADKETRIRRVMSRDAKTYEQIEAIIQKQMPEEEKIRRADFIIYNNGSLEELQTEVEGFLHRLQNV